MNNEQERAEFELVRDKAYRSEPGTFDAWDAWQARAALQSQDREDAERYRWLRDNAQIFSHFGGEGNSGWCVMRRDSTITRVFTYNGQELDEAIDHALRVEEDEQGYCNLDLACEGGSSCDACRPSEPVAEEAEQYL